MTSFRSEYADSSKQLENFLSRYEAFPEPTPVKGRWVVEEFERILSESLDAERPDWVLSLVAKLYARRLRAQISQGTWLNLLELLEGRVATKTAPEWKHLAECLRATMCSIHVQLFALALAKPVFDVLQNGWNQRIEATLLPDWSYRYRSALLFFVVELFPGSAGEEKALLAKQAGCCRAGTPVLEPPSRALSPEWPRLLTGMARAAAAAPTARTLRGLAAALGEGDDPAEIELLLYHWGASCSICRDLLEAWTGELWSAAERPEPPLLPAPRGPEVDVLLAGLPGAGKSSLLFALESEGLVDVVPIRPQRAPSLNPFSAGSSAEVQVAELRDKWQAGHPDATAEPLLQARPRASRQLVFPNFLDLPGACFTADGAGKPSWIRAWRNRQPPCCLVLVLRFDGEGAMPAEQGAAEALCRIPDLIPSGCPIYLVAGALDLAGLDEATMDALDRPFSLHWSADGRPSVLSAEHRELSLCLPALRKVSRDLARLAANGLAAKIQQRSAGAPVTLVYGCLQGGNSFAGRRRAGCQAFWRALIGDLAPATAASRRAWLNEFFVQRPQNALAAVASYRGSLQHLLGQLRRLADAVRAVDQLDPARLPQSIGCLSPGNLESAIQRLEAWQLPEGNPWYAYEQSLTDTSAAAREAARLLLVLLGVAGTGSAEGGFVIAEPVPSQADALRVLVTLRLPQPRHVEISPVEGVLVTGCAVLDGGSGAGERFKPLIGVGVYGPLQLLDLEAAPAKALLEEMIGSAASPFGPFGPFSLRRNELDVFHLEALQAMQPEDLPPVKDLLESFVRLTRLWRWIQSREATWRSSKIVWLKRRAAEQVKQWLVSREPKPEALTEALADAEGWQMWWPIGRQKAETILLGKLKGVLSAQSESKLKAALNDNDLFGEVRGMLKDLATALRVAELPGVASADVDLGAPRLGELQNLLKDLEVALIGNGLVELTLARYEDVIRNERTAYLRISGWLNGQTNIAPFDSASWLGAACFHETASSSLEAV